MASICNRCALRIQRAAENTTAYLSKRALSQSTRPRGPNLPAFHETSNHELNTILSNLKQHHIIPAQLRKSERKLIFKPENKQLLHDNPQATYIGDEEVELQWLDKNNCISKRRYLVKDALNLILDSSDNKTWENLPKMLEGLKEGVNAPLTDAEMGKIVRKAIANNKIFYAMTCFHKGATTGMTLKSETALRELLVGIRLSASRSNWDKKPLEMAIKQMAMITEMLESELHGGGRNVSLSDPRTRPEVLAMFLELSAAYALRHSEAKDIGGVVKTYAERYLSVAPSQALWVHFHPETRQGFVRRQYPSPIQLLERGPQWSFLFALPIYHGLLLARRILGEEMPERPKAEEVLSTYEPVMARLAGELETRNPAEGSYDAQALSAWRAVNSE